MAELIWDMLNPGVHSGAFHKENVMTMTRAQMRHQRVREINKAHDSSHASFHADYRKKHNAILKESGVPAGTPFHLIPVEVHEKLEKQKKALVANLQLAQEAKLSTVSSLPRITNRSVGKFLN